MSVIYEPKGMALEYAELAANLYRGCVVPIRWFWNEEGSPLAGKRPPSARKAESGANIWRAWATQSGPMAG